MAMVASASAVNQQPVIEEESLGRGRSEWEKVDDG